jgi:predicted anti-sigma-YlaC factor YlaD
MDMKVFQPRTGQRCERIREWISLELDGELSRIERALVERHLDTCPECSAFAVHVDAFTDALRAAPLEQLERPIALPARSRLRVRSFQVAAAAALAVGAVGLATLSSSLQERLGATIRPIQGSVQVDEGREQLRARQLRQLTERIAQTMPRPVGTQPV